MKSIYITRNITLQRTGHDDVVLPKGHHTVADDVAEHPFVKHHVASSTDVEDGAADLQALLDQTRIAAASEIEHLQATLAAAQATIAEQQTTLAAYAAMTPAADAKAKK